MSENLRIVKELYRTFSEKDYEAFLELCAPDIEWRQNEGFPNGATHRGANAVVNGVFRQFNSEWEMFRFDIEDYIDGGDSIIVVGSYVGTHGRTGCAMRSAACHVYDIADGVITRYRQFADTKPIWDAIAG